MDDEQPYAQITQIGRWSWRIAIYHGCMVYGPDGYGWTRLGRQRAERLARRQLAAYTQRQHRQANPIRITAEDPER